MHDVGNKNALRDSQRAIQPRRRALRQLAAKHASNASAQQQKGGGFRRCCHSRNGDVRSACEIYVSKAAYTYALGDHVKRPRLKDWAGFGAGVDLGGMDTEVLVASAARKAEEQAAECLRIKIGSIDCVSNRDRSPIQRVLEALDDKVGVIAGGLIDDGQRVNQEAKAVASSGCGVRRRWCPAAEGAGLCDFQGRAQAELAERTHKRTTVNRVRRSMRRSFLIGEMLRD